MVGAKVVFFSGDIKNLSDDMKAIKPTVVPGLLLRFYEQRRFSFLQVIVANNALLISLTERPFYH